MTVKIKYTFIKRQKNNVKGWEVNYNYGTGLLEYDVLGFFKSMREARQYVTQHQLKLRNLETK